MKQLIFASLLLLSLGAAAQIQPCKGTTKAGKPCGNVAAKGSMYCRLHNPNAFHCGATTKEGKPCQIVVKAEGLKCWRHK